MHRFLLPILASLAFFFLPSCSKIELPSEEEPDKPQQEPGGNEDEYGDVLTVAQAKEAHEGDYVAIAGYIVGYVKGTSLSESNAIFALPTESPNTNMLLADRKDETDYRHCFPVSLPAKTKYEDIRGELNLFDNPHLFRQRIVIEGELVAYFRTLGMKKMEYYALFPKEGEGGEGNDDPNGGSDEKPKPDEPPVGPQVPIDLPALDDNEQWVPEGR